MRALAFVRNAKAEPSSPTPDLKIHAEPRPTNGPDRTQDEAPQAQHSNAIEARNLAFEEENLSKIQAPLPFAKARA